MRIIFLFLCAVSAVCALSFSEKISFRDEKKMKATNFHFKAPLASESSSGNEFDLPGSIINTMLYYLGQEKYTLQITSLDPVQNKVSQDTKLPNLKKLHTSSMNDRTCLSIFHSMSCYKS